MRIEKLRKRFCKDSGYKINSFDDNYFFYKLANIEGGIESYEKFEDMLMQYDSPESFLDAYDELCNQIIDHIKNKESYQKFNSMDISDYVVKSDIPSKTVFKGDNVGKNLISIDMKKANFSSLRMYDEEIFDHKDNWQDFLKQFTDNDYIINSKNIRQIIMGNCNPKRQGIYEKYLMNLFLLKDMQEYFNGDQFIFFGNDEIVIDVTNQDIKEAQNIITNIVNNSYVPCDIETFKLCAILNIDDKIEGYYKKHENGIIEFKSIDPVLLPIAQKAIMNEPISEEDLVFDTNFGPVKLINPPVLKSIESLQKNEEELDQER